MALLTPEQALERILDVVKPLAAEKVPIDEALGRALSDDVVANRTLPPHDNSAMDGFAVRSADVHQGAVTLSVIGTLFAGDKPTLKVAAGQAVRIMTGAPMPEGADAVVMQEKVTVTNNGVTLTGPVTPRLNVRNHGEDASAGQILLKASTALGVPEAAQLWAQGLTHVSVSRRPQVALVSSGDELCGITDAPHGRIVDTNSPALAAAVRRAGGVPTLLGIAADTLPSVTALVAKGLDHDVLLTSAGVSVGEKDFARDAFAALGVEASFWKVGIKPGKPLAFGTRGNTLVFGLPGNPASSLVSFELFVRPALRRLMGRTDLEPQRMPARSASPYVKPAGIRHFVRVRGVWRDGELWAEPLTSQTSGAWASTQGATHLMVVRENVTQVIVGDKVELIAASWVA
ncbi:MAG: molybdopterin molybdotransferase MoeA [Myxococcaceae bacterium]|nr:molybdopterin molybdotransferase MoeA [Myxococcaceae bacterium]